MRRSKAERINLMVVDLYHGDVVTSFANAEKSSIRGIIHKATQGTRVADSAYEAHRKNANDASLLGGRIISRRTRTSWRRSCTFSVPCSRSLPRLSRSTLSRTAYDGMAEQRPTEWRHDRCDYRRGCRADNRWRARFPSPMLRVRAML